MQSGVDNLALVLAQVVGVLLSGGLVTKLGYYNPFMIAAPVFIAIGAGLATTFSLTTPTHQWIGYQIIIGIGTGFGFQQPIISAQTVLPLPDVPVGTAFVIFIQLLGGALFVSVAQNVFGQKLIEGLVGVPGVDLGGLAQVGATQLRDAIPDPVLQQTVLVAYNAALTKVFQVGLIMGAIAIIGALGMEWKSVKGKQPEAVAA